MYNVHANTDARNISLFVSLKSDNDIHNLSYWRNEECESDNNSILVIDSRPPLTLPLPLSACKYFADTNWTEPKLYSCKWPFWLISRHYEISELVWKSFRITKGRRSHTHTQTDSQINCQWLRRLKYGHYKYKVEINPGENRLRAVKALSTVDVNEIDKEQAARGEMQYTCIHTWHDRVKPIAIESKINGNGMS